MKKDMKEKILYTTSTIYDEQGFSIRQGIKKDTRISKTRRNKQKN